MPRYTFQELSSFDFEELVADLLDAEWSTRFERFKPGPDQGIDLRCTPHPGRAVVVQCKHMVGSTVAQLFASLRREVAKVHALAPDRYVVATSLGLTPANTRASTLA